MGEQGGRARWQSKVGGQRGRASGGGGGLARTTGCPAELCSGWCVGGAVERLRGFGLFYLGVRFRIRGAVEGCVWSFPSFTPTTACERTILYYTLLCYTTLFYSMLCYDRVRASQGFMVQTGDPLGDGTGGTSIWVIFYRHVGSPCPV